MLTGGITTGAMEPLAQRPASEGSWKVPVRQHDAVHRFLWAGAPHAQCRVQRAGGEDLSRRCQGPDSHQGSALLQQDVRLFLFCMTA